MACCLAVTHSCCFLCALVCDLSYWCPRAHEFLSVVMLEIRAWSLHYVTYILTNSRYSWSYEVCVWWTAEVSRHSADESLQTCISKVDIRTICELTTIRVWFFGCWLWWKYELIVILYRQLYTCLQYLTVS